MRRLSLALSLIAATGLGTVAGSAQESTIAFEGLKAGAKEPVEITSDQLSVSQADNTALFEGKVVVIQGGLRLASDKLKVEYVQGDKTKIDRLIATGNVLLSTPSEAAKAESAVYVLTTSQLTMEGNVVLTQNGNAMSGQVLTVDIKAGTGRMSGRVKTILQPAGN